MDLIGKQLGRYKIEDEIGHGGMAVVYRAVDVQTNNVVALKVLLMHLGNDVTQRQRFIREAAQVSRLQHPNIVDVYEVDTADGYWFIAMEIVEGQALSTFLLSQSNRLSGERATEIIAAVAAGLEHAHSQGLIHRDIKPGNILLGDDGRILLTDFGLAKLIDVEQTAYTRLGTSIGTPAYMSPEQASGKELDKRTDIYSLGVVAYLLFAGKTPHAADNTPALLHKVVYDPIHPPELYNPEIPSGIVFALNRVLAKDPQARYQTAGSFAEALREGKSWVPSSAAQQAVIAAQTKMPDTPQGITSASSNARKNRRLTGWLLLLGAAGLTLAATLLFLFWGQLGFDSSGINTPATQLITLVPYRASDGSYSINRPDEWTRSEEEDARTQFVKFDAEDASARIFILEDAQGAIEIEQITSVDLRQYLIDKPIAFADVKERSAMETEGLLDDEIVRQRFTVQWRGHPTVVTLSGYSDGESFFLLGSAIEEQAYLKDGTFAQLHRKIAGSFRVEEPEIALLPPTPTPTATGAPTQEPKPSATATETPMPTPLTKMTDTAISDPTSTATVTATATQTATDNPTSTPEPSATAAATSTPQPTVTGTATPLPTSTSRPTSTSTPLPTATHTATPTATLTATRKPTSTPISTVTRTATLQPTSTSRPTSTLTPLPTATDKPTSTSLATRTATPAATSTRRPTSTPLPIATRTPTSRPTATRTATSRPTSTPAPTATWTQTPSPTSTTAPAIPQGQVALIGPEPGISLSGSYPHIFSWTALPNLSPSLLYELVFWRPGGDGLVDGRSPVGARSGTSVQVDLAAADANPNMGETIDAGEICWGIRLWDTAANRAAGMASDGCRLFTYTGTGGGSGSSGGGSDDCPGCGGK